MECIVKYFPELSAAQREQFAMLEPLYKEWNSKINVISRKDIDSIYKHHILHSLAIAKVISFAKNTKIVDIGTGGGFPGIPLAILFPYCSFTLIDSIGKKTIVASEIAQTIGLTNVKAIKSRAEELDGVYDFVVSRAVAPLPTISSWVKKIIKPGGYNQLPNGIIVLKGGDLKEELAPFQKVLKKWPIENFFEEEYFQEKYVIFVPR